MATCVDLEDDVTCCVCVDLFTDPVMLPCMHTLCNACALQVRGRSGKANVIQCPLCQANCKYSQLRMDFNKRKLVDIYKKALDSATAPQSIPSDETKLCGYCETEEAGWKCVDCDINLCTKCKIGHSKIPVCSSHVITELERSTPVVFSEDSVLYKLKEYERKLESLQNDCKDNYEKIEEYTRYIYKEVEELKKTLSDLEQSIIRKTQAKIKQERDKGIGILMKEETTMNKHSDELHAKQNELEETLVVIRNVLQEHGNSSSKDQDPFLLDVLNQAENVHNEFQSTIQKLTVPNERLFAKVLSPDWNKLVKTIDVSVPRKPTTPAAPQAPTDQSGGASAEQPQGSTAEGAEGLSPTAQTPTSKISSFFSKRSSSQKRQDNKRDTSAKRKSLRSQRRNAAEQMTSPQRQPSSLDNPPSVVPAAPTAPTERAPPNTPLPRSALSSSSRRPPRRQSSDSDIMGRPRGHQSRREVAFALAESPPPYSSCVSSIAGFVLDAPVITGAFSIGPPSLSAFTGKQLIKTPLYGFNTRPNRIHIIENTFWTVLEDGSITALNRDRSHARDFRVHMPSQNSLLDAGVPFSVSAVASAHNGDIIAACVGIATQGNSATFANSQPGLCIVNESGECLHVISHDHYLELTRGGESIYALRKSDRSVMEFKLLDNYWTFIRKIELVPTTQYTHLLCYDEYLYASAMLPDVIHKVHLHSGQIKTLGFRGPGAPGELRSPRVSCTDEEGNVLVTDYWNNRLQVLLADNSWWVLNVEGNIAGPQDAVLDATTNTLMVLSYVDRMLFVITGV